MTFLESIQSMLPRPEHRSRPEIDRDLEDEFAFHLEMRTRAIETEEGLEREAACGLAHERFGDIDRIRKDCQRIALKERAMMQRVNFVLMIVVLLFVAAVGIQVMITQRYNTLALQAITADLARMKFEAEAAVRQPGASPTAAGDTTDAARVLVEGDIDQVGWHAIDMDRGTRLGELLDALNVKDDQWITYRRNGATGGVRQQLVKSFRAEQGGMVLRPNDELTIEDDVSIESRRTYFMDQWGARREPVQLWEAHTTNGETWLIKTSSVRRSTGTLIKSNDSMEWRLTFQPYGVTIMAIVDGRGHTWLGDWDVVDGQLIMDFSNLRDDPRTARLQEPSSQSHMPMTSGQLVFVQTNDVPTVVAISRVRDVGDFVVRLFAVADPHDPEVDQSIRNFLDSEEQSLDQKYVDDPATAGMIRELIDARRKVFEADAQALRLKDAEAKAKALTDFLAQTLTAANPQAAATLNVRDVLDHAATQIDERFANDPETAARVRAAITAATWQVNADDGAADTSIRLSDDHLKYIISRLMVASMPNADPSHLPTRDELQQWEDETRRQFAGRGGDEKILGMIATVRTRLDDIEGGHAEVRHAVQPAAPRANDDAFPELSPFRAVRWKDYTPFVDVGDVWGELVSINDIPIEQIIDFCAKRYGSRDRKRFTEDLIQVMTEMGRPPMHGTHVKLQIKEHSTGTVMAIDRAPMTEANRRLLWDANNAASESDPPYPVWTGEPPPAVEGEPQANARDRLPALPATLTLPQMEEDLASLANAMRTRFSYLHLQSVDLDAAVAETRAMLIDGMPTDDFAFALQRMIARFGDGHAGVSGLSAFTPPVFAPFQMRAVDNTRIAAFAADGSALLDPSHPYLVSINGVPIEKLLDAAKKYVVDGSPALIRRRSIDIVHRLGLLVNDEELANVDLTKEIVVELGSGEGVISEVLGPPLASPRYRDRPDRESGLIENDTIGYIRLAAMDEESARLAKWLMPRFMNTRGLIIDVRGNGGGSRDALLTLLPHVLAPDAPPLVLNIAAYRLNPAFGEDHLGQRFMHRRDDSKWSDAERAAIDAAAATFKPNWQPPRLEEDFSDWHYLVISREAAAKANADLYHYDKPVIVLCDGGCFSATDIFLGAFKGLPNVTLMGTTSSGGSGRKQSIRLANSGLAISLSSMISYRPDGAMFDRRGVEPDVIVEPVPTDFVVESGTDTQLDAAIARILELR